MHRFLRLIYIIDAVGVIGLVLAVLGFYFTNLTSSETAQLSGNLGIELIGSWISVRILEYIIRQREEYKSSRSQVLKNLRFFLHFTRRLRGNIIYADLEQLRSELRYTEHVFDQRKKWLHQTEINKCFIAYDQLRALISAAEQAMDRTSEYRSSRSLFDKKIRDRAVNAKSPSVEERAALSMLYAHAIDVVNSAKTSVDIGSIDNYLSLLPDINETVADDLREIIRQMIECKNKENEAIDHMYRMWDEYEIVVQDVEADIREETPES